MYNYALQSMQARYASPQQNQKKTTQPFLLAFFYNPLHECSVATQRYTVQQSHFQENPLHTLYTILPLLPFLLYSQAVRPSPPFFSHLDTTIKKITNTNTPNILPPYRPPPSSLSTQKTYLVLTNIKHLLDPPRLGLRRRVSVQFLKGTCPPAPME